MRSADQVAPVKGGRMFSLDILRGLAILLVLLLHFPPTVLISGGWLDIAVRWLASVGWIGVDLFFVLSGFLISGLIYAEYDKHGGFRAGRFLLRRGFKIWPAYFAAYGGMTLARIAAEFWKGNGERAGELAQHAVCNALFVQNYLPCQRWSHSWSLAVEEHFYTALALLLGFVVWRAAKRNRSGRDAFAVVLPLAAAVALLALVLRVLQCFPEYIERGQNAYYQSHMRADSLFCGVLLGYFVRYRHEVLGALARRHWVLLALGSAVLWPSLFPHGASPWSESVALTLIYLSFAVVVAAAALNPDFGAKAGGVAGTVARGLAWLGLYSYTVYLAHSILFGIPGVETLRQRLLGSLLTMLSESSVLWIDRALFLTCSIALGVLLSHLVERPLLRMRERLLPSPSLDVSRVPFCSRVGIV